MSAYTVLCTPTLAFRSAIGIVDSFPNHFSMTDWKWSLSFPPLSSVCIVIASYFPLKNGLTILDPWISYLISNSRAIFCTLSMQFPVYGRHFPVEISHFRPIGPTYSNCDLVASSRFLISFRHSMLLWLSEDYISCGFWNISTFTMRRYDSPVCKPFGSQGRVWIAFAGECSFSGICCYRVELLTILSSLLHYSACDRQ